MQSYLMDLFIILVLPQYHLFFQQIFFEHLLFWVQGIYQGPKETIKIQSGYLAISQHKNSTRDCCHGERLELIEGHLLELGWQKSLPEKVTFEVSLGTTRTWAVLERWHFTQKKQLGKRPCDVWVLRKFQHHFNRLSQLAWTLKISTHRSQMSFSSQNSVNILWVLRIGNNILGIQLGIHDIWTI